MEEQRAGQVRPRASGRTSDRRIGVLDAVGNTPLLDLSRIAGQVPPVKICGKAEWLNPGGSAKDRSVLNIIKEGERSGSLNHARMILDAASGDSAVAYAVIGAAAGYRVKLVMPENVDSRLLQAVKACGAEVIFTDPLDGLAGAVAEARLLYHLSPQAYYLADQYRNPANWRAHYRGTALEILRQTNREVTHFVAGLGTGGTFMGVGHRLAEELSDVQLVSYHLGESDLETNGIYDPNLADRHYQISCEEATAMARELARNEGLLLGLNSAAAVVCALRVAREMTSGLIVVILPDSAMTYSGHAFWQKD